MVCLPLYFYLIFPSLPLCSSVVFLWEGVRYYKNPQLGPFTCLCFDWVTKDAGFSNLCFFMFMWQPVPTWWHSSSRGMWPFDSLWPFQRPNLGSSPHLRTLFPFSQANPLRVNPALVMAAEGPIQLISSIFRYSWASLGLEVPGWSIDMKAGPYLSGSSPWSPTPQSPHFPGLKMGSVF